MNKILTMFKVFRVKSFLAMMLIVLLLCGTAMPVSAEKLIERYDSFYNVVSNEEEELLSHNSILENYKEEGYTAASAAVSISLDTFIINGENYSFNTHDNIDSLITKDDTTVTFSFEVENAGFYELELTYKLKVNSMAPAKRNIKIDGKIPFAEAVNVEFDPHFVFSKEKEYDKQGNQISSATISDNDWQTIRVRDAKEQIYTPLNFALSAGEHTISFEFVEKDIEISSLKFVAPEQVSNYASVSKKYGTLNKDVKEIIFEAEDADYIAAVNSSTLLPYADKDPKMSPVSDAKTIYNAIGGSSWSSNGQKIVYQFEVEKTGLYKLALRFIQNFGNGSTSYRRIEIDGKVPFEEFFCYPFEENSNWHCEAIDNDKDEPYLLYLEKGKHTIGFTAVTSDEISAASDLCLDIQDDLYALYRRIILITGTSPDPNYVYELDKAVPELIPELKKIINSLEEMCQRISEAQKNTSNDNEIKKIIHQLTALVDDTESIPKKLDEFTDTTNTLGNLSSSLLNSSLAIDTIYLMPADKKVDASKASLWSRIVMLLKDFIRSFSSDYVVVDDTTKENRLNIWVSAAQLRVAQMKSLIYKDFEKKYNCTVDINVVPSDTLNGGSQNPLMLAVASGNSPDLVINVSPTTPVEYGMRGVAADLSQFENYEQVIKRFVPGIMKSYEFMGKVYAVPQEMNFSVMAYRKDIFDELGIAVPRTWEDVHFKLLPILYQNSMQMAAVAFPTLLYQYGGQYYSEDGLSIELDTPQAHKAFEEYNSQFMDLGYPISANFFNRFKSGEMPIGFIDLAGYMQLLVAAPELADKWAITNIPGTVQADGTISRAHTTLNSTANMILTTGHNIDMAWNFIDWWSTTEVQTEYYTRIESILGMAARSLPATVEAVKNLPWKSGDLQVILDCWSDAVAVPYVLGGVITDREVTNAVNNVLYNNYTSRQALERAVKNINDELLRKQEMYDIKRGE